MIYKSFKNLLFELKEAKSYEDKAKVFHEYFYNDKDYVEFICTNDSLDNPKERKVCYLSDLINPLKLLWNRDIVAISDILFMASRKKRLVLSLRMKEILVYFFHINKASLVKDIVWFYPFIRYDINNRPRYEVFRLEDYGISYSDSYISIVLPKKRREELEVIRIKDLNGKLLDEVEITNIRGYYQDLQKYVINDKLILSIISGIYRDVVVSYLELNTFNKVGSELGFSTTKARVTFYTAIKKIVSFFYSIEGVRALLLIFSRNDGYITSSDLCILFPRFHKIIEYIFKKEYLYHIKYNKDKDRYESIEEEKMIKLVGFDLDDTLLNSKKEIQDKEAILELIKNGIKVCFCSGRPYVQKVKDYYKEIGLTHNVYYVAFNGVAVYRVDDDKLIYGNYLNKEEVERIACIVNNTINKYFKPDDFAMYCYKMDNTVESTRLNDYVMLEEKFNKTKIVVNDFWKDGICGHKIMISGEPKLVKELFGYIEKELSKDFEVLISMPFFIEVYKKNNDKYQSLLKVAKRYGIDASEIMTFGDSLNDYTLVKNGAIGIAMGNSVEVVKEAASFVTSDNDHYGVTEALIKYGLIKKGSNQ